MYFYGRILVLISVLLGFSSCMSIDLKGETCTQSDYTGMGITVAKVTVEQAETQSLKRIRESGTDTPAVPFGYNNDEWLRLKKRLNEESDCLIEYDAFKSRDSRIGGSAGILIQRKNKVVYVMRNSII